MLVSILEHNTVTIQCGYVSSVECAEIKIQVIKFH
ncbi:hypothetical protein ECH_1029 [Ehrlichia chaffeensis str. Arkansas]|uniref:Uncharacterized protein n=1 Tax=Ehrlichia chaffeensis (strain ATCC CRL-10679 / Arkansas) TaxID=205920 RepID=Q2GFG8_EHRCR|nr:hypothetical protein ECH_1029 [Ehrlichia chaffeensis str. Arkansas]